MWLDNSSDKLHITCIAILKIVDPSFEQNTADPMQLTSLYTSSLLYKL